MVKAAWNRIRRLEDANVRASLQAFFCECRRARTLAAPTSRSADPHAGADFDSRGERPQGARPSRRGMKSMTYPRKFK
jgi:hypothetical protein